MNYVADTHSLVWYFTRDSRLGSKALSAFESTVEIGTVIIPTVALAEIMYISGKGRIPLSFEETVARIEELENFQISPLNLGVLLIANRIKESLELHDKVIVATALYADAKLITADDKIRESRSVDIVW